LFSTQALDLSVSADSTTVPIGFFAIASKETFLEIYLEYRCGGCLPLALFLVCTSTRRNDIKQMSQPARRGDHANLMGGKITRKAQQPPASQEARKKRT
jgi:hypothetical protein